MPPGRFADLNDLPSWEQYREAARSVVGSLAVNDPEDTLLVQLTFMELATVTLGLLMLSRVFPELEILAARVADKLKELSATQEFLRRESTSD